MGSFNMTCFASQRTIAQGNTAYIFPVCQQATFEAVELSLGDVKISQFGGSHAACYSDAFWKYAGPMVEGKYTDYGSFTLTNSKANQASLVHLFNIFYEDMFKVAQGSNSSHDLPLDFQAMYNPKEQYTFDVLEAIWGEVWQVGLKNRLFLNDRGNARQLQFLPLHKKSADFFMQYSAGIKIGDKTMEEQFEDAIKKRTEIMFKYKDSESALEMALDMIPSDITNLSQVYSAQGFHYYDLYGGKNEVKECLHNFVKKNPTAQGLDNATMSKLKKICEVAFKHRLIHVGFEHFNIVLNPQTLGNQDYSNDVGKSYLRFIEAVNGKNVKSNKNTA